MFNIINYSNNYLDSYFETVFTGAFVSTLLVIALLGYIITAISLMKIFAKANVPAWKAWIPFVNSWKFMELGGYSGAWIFAFLIPFVGSLVLFVMDCLAAYNIGLKLGKSGVWVIIYIFFGLIWLLICAFDSSRWDDSLGQPARGREIPPSSRGYNARNPYGNHSGVA